MEIDEYDPVIVEIKNLLTDSMAASCDMDDAEDTPYCDVRPGLVI